MATGWLNKAWAVVTRPAADLCVMSQDLESSLTAPVFLDGYQTFKNAAYDITTVSGTGFVSDMKHTYTNTFHRLQFQDQQS